MNEQWKTAPRAVLCDCSTNGHVRSPGDKEIDPLDSGHQQFHHRKGPSNPFADEPKHCDDGEQNVLELPPIRVVVVVAELLLVCSEENRGLILLVQLVLQPLPSRAVEGEVCRTDDGDLLTHF